MPGVILASLSSAGSWHPMVVVRSQDPSLPSARIPVLSCVTGADQRTSYFSANNLRVPPEKKRCSLWDRWSLPNVLESSDKQVWINTVAFISSKKNTSLCLSSMSQRILIHLDTAPFLLKDTAMQIYSSVFHLFSWSFLIEVKGTLVGVLLWPRESSSFSTSLVFIYFFHVFERRMALFFLSLLKDEDKRKSD